MTGRGDSGERKRRGPLNAGPRHPGGGGNQGPGPSDNPPPRTSGGPARKPQPPKRKGGLRLRRLAGDAFELDHPRCVAEMELDYAEGMEFYHDGDLEAARDALRYALQGCGDNLWVHVALGRIALDQRDARLARGHYGYAFELAQRAIPPGFGGRLPPDRLANEPFYEALEGLSLSYDALGKPGEAASLRKLAERLARGRSREGDGSPR